MIEQQEIKKYFEYDNKGFLIWKEKTSCKSRIEIGSIAGTIKKDGYTRLQFKGKKYYVHVLIWVYHNGTIPINMEVDHINPGYNVKENNIENLQLLSKSHNSLKKRANKNGLSKYKGVTKDKRNKDKPWRCYYTFNGKRYYIGSFETELDAALAYDEKVKETKINTSFLNFGVDSK